MLYLLRTQVPELNFQVQAPTHHFAAMGPWVSILTSRCLSFFTGKLGITIVFIL